LVVCSFAVSTFGCRPVLRAIKTTLGAFNGAGKPVAGRSDFNIRIYVLTSISS